jgi:hypothetical protein
MTQLTADEQTILQAFQAAVATYKQQGRDLPENIAAIGDHLEPHIEWLDALSEGDPTFEMVYKSTKSALQNQSGQRSKLLISEPTHRFSSSVAPSASTPTPHIIDPVESPIPIPIEDSKITQEKILKALSSSHFRTKDIAHIINQPLDRTQSILQKLWRSGDIDRLDSSLIYILFPNLRSQPYRQQTIAPDQFLTITSKGYFHLYPLITRLRRG